MLSLAFIAFSFLTILKHSQSTQITYHNAIKQLSQNISFNKKFLSLENSTQLVIIQNNLLQQIDFMTDMITNQVEFDTEIQTLAAINDTFFLVGNKEEIASLNFSSNNIISKYIQEAVNQISVGEKNFIADNQNITCAWGIDSGIKLNCLAASEIYLSMIALKGSNFNESAIFGNTNGKLIIWNYVSNTTTTIVENQEGKEVVGLVQLNKTESLVSLSSQGKISVWNLNQNYKIKTILINEIKFISQIRNSNRLLTLDQKSTIKIYNTDTWEPIQASYFFKHVSNAVSTNLPNILAFSQSQKISILDISQPITQILGYHQKQLNQISQLAGTDILITASDDNTLSSWNLTTNSLISTFNGNEKVKSFAWITNTTNIITIEQFLKVYKWNYQTGEKQFVTQYVDPEEDNPFTFTSLALKEEKKVIMGSTNRLLKFNLTTMQFEDDSMELINCLAIAEMNNNSIATGNFSDNIYIWDILTNTLITTFQAHDLGILQLIYDSATDYLISSSYDSRVKIFKGSDYSLVHLFNIHLNPVESLALQVTRNQKVLYSSGWDSQIIAWDIETGEQLKLFQNFPSHKILLIENSDRMVAANMDGIIEIFSKSYSCSLNSTSFEFNECLCSGVGKQEVQQLADSSICAVILEELPIFTAIQSPDTFSLTFLFEQAELINKLISQTQTLTKLTIGNLQYGTDYNYTLEYTSDQQLLLKIEYLTQVNLDINTEISFFLLVDDYINNNKYILVEKNFTYNTTTSQITCTTDQYYDKVSQSCKQSVLLEPLISLNSEPNVLKITFLNKEHSIFSSMANYIEVLSIQGYPQEIYTYTVTQKSFDIYLITFTFKRDILDNPLVTVFINIPEQLLQSGELQITTQFLKINLMKNFYVSESEEETIESLGVTTSVGTGAVAGLAVMSSFTGSTSCFRMSMLLGLIELLKYQNINYTPAVLKLFESQSEFPPEFVGSLKMQFKEDNTKDLQSLPDNFTKYDISPYVLNNLVQKVLIIVLGIMLGFGLSALNKILKKYKYSQRKIVKSLMSLWSWMYQWIVWNFIYFILIDAFLEIVLYSLIEVSCTPVYSIKGKFNLFCGVFFLLASLFLIYHFYLKIESLSQIQSELKDVKSEANSPELPKNQKQILTPYKVQKNLLKKLIANFQRVLKQWYQPQFQSLEDKKQYLADHEILFNDYKPNAHLSYNFILFELGRLFAICTVIVLLREYPLLQTILNLLILVFFVIVLFIIKPYKKMVMSILSVFIEFCVISAYMGAFLFAQYDQNGDVESTNAYKNIEKFVIYGVLGITYISIVLLLINAIDFIKLLVEKFKQFQKRKRKQSSELFQIKQKKNITFKPLQISQQQQPAQLQQDSPQEEIEKSEKQILQEIVIDQLQEDSLEEKKAEKSNLQEIIIDQLEQDSPQEIIEIIEKSNLQTIVTEQLQQNSAEDQEEIEKAEKSNLQQIVIDQ